MEFADFIFLMVSSYLVSQLSWYMTSSTDKWYERNKINKYMNKQTNKQKTLKSFYNHRISKYGSSKHTCLCGTSSKKNTPYTKYRPTFSLNTPEGGRLREGPLGLRCVTCFRGSPFVSSVRLRSSAMWMHICNYS